MPKKNEKKYDWLEIKSRWFKGEKIETLGSEYGFNVKYWYKRYRKDWAREKEFLMESAEELVYEKALKEEIEKREVFRANYSSMYNKLFMFTVQNMANLEEMLKGDGSKTVAGKFNIQKLIKITSETVAILKEGAFDIEYIYTKADKTGDLLQGETVEEPIVEKV